ncbi:hypothetical protein I302_108077 [Kwoniella bestiolae CBS 10118]|uniref:Uncharacterized protein n=1 Tax=Kwoniella bestiolae CBS 10118 TaxID=1296100 RepID=A0A1B9FWQ7_9TREE|nr:hypothetical protein I302_07557 [Kwoniella bestiolae CBS 10118]OCF23203.1 hypothetical protein I302_07557 [Kwoniella bestiolae CBS 10118]
MDNTDPTSVSTGSSAVLNSSIARPDSAIDLEQALQAETGVDTAHLPPELADDFGKSSYVPERLEELSQQVEGKVFELQSVCTGEEGFKEVVSDKPFDRTARYSRVFVSETLATKIERSAQPWGAEDFGVTGGVHALRTVRGEELGEDLHVSFIRFQEEDGRITFFARHVDDIEGPDGNNDRTKFYTEQLEGQTCSTTTLSEGGNMYKLEILGKGTNDYPPVKYRTDGKFYNELVRNGREHRAGSTHGHVWAI